MTIIMLSNKTFLPDYFVGLLCFKCKRTDFGGSARRLSSHVRTVTSSWVIHGAIIDDLVISILELTFNVHIIIASAIYDMDNSNPTCIYLKRDDYHQHIAMQSTLEAQHDRLNMDAPLSKNPIINAFMIPEVPLSDLGCGIYGMTPPERLHTTCEDIFESLLDTITKSTEGNALIRQMELLHFTLHFQWNRNAESN